MLRCGRDGHLARNCDKPGLATDSEDDRPTETAAEFGVTPILSSDGVRRVVVWELEQGDWDLVVQTIYTRRQNDATGHSPNSRGYQRERLRESASRIWRGYDVRVRPLKFPVDTWVLYYSSRKFLGRSPKWQRNYGCR